MNSYIAELRSNRAAIVRQMSETLTSNRADKMSRWRELDDKQEKLRLDIETAERREHAQLPAVDTRMNGQRETAGLPENRAKWPHNLCAAELSEYREVFEGFVRTGDQREVRALGAIASDNGYTLVPVGFQREVAQY